MRDPALKPKSRLFFLLTAVISIGFGVLLFVGLSQSPKDIQSALIGKKAANFTIKLIQGKDLDSDQDGRLSLSELAGQNVIINFWASWCVSCRQEAVDFQKFYLMDHKTDVTLVGIAIQDTMEDARQFAGVHGKTYALGLDDSGNTGIDYGVTGVPETFWINRQGTIIEKFAGPLTTEMLIEKMKLF
jgi:cytochrome c biogenesis protein CcmG, thiol:disulfide interchange protein DsbE